MLRQTEYLLRVHGPMLALVGIMLLAGYYDGNRELGRFGFQLHLIPIGAAMAAIILNLHRKQPVPCSPEKPTAAGSRQAWRQLAGLLAALTAALLLRWSRDGEPPFALDYCLLTLTVGAAYGLLFLNNLQRRIPGLFKAAGGKMARADYPALLAGCLAVTLFYPTADPWEILLAASIILYAAILYAEHRLRYGSEPDPAAGEPPTAGERP